MIRSAHLSRPLALLASLCLLTACATAPQTTTLGGLSLTLPAGFEDTSDEMQRYFQLHAATMARHSGKLGVRLEPLRAFEARQQRTAGGCGVTRLHIASTSELWGWGLPQLIERLSTSGVDTRPPWARLSDGGTMPFDPWTVRNSVQLVSSAATSLAGHSAWQQTRRMDWRAEPGPYQPVALMSTVMADIRPAGAITTVPSLAGERQVLWATCSVVDLEAYTRTALDDVLAVMGSLAWAGTPPP